MSPKEVAEMIINQKQFEQEDFMWLVHNSEVLSRAYLELEKKLSLEQQDRESEKREFKVFKDAAENEITKLKKSREWLRKACEFYGNWVNSPDGIIHKSDCETIFVHEPLEKDKNGIVVAGKKAREALKADDEIMGCGE